MSGLRAGSCGWLSVLLAVVPSCGGEPSPSTGTTEAPAVTTSGSEAQADGTSATTYQATQGAEASSEGDDASSSEGGIDPPEVACTRRVFGEPAEDRLGPFEVIAGELYVVASGLAGPGGNLADVAHMVVLRGLDETVWVFGMGWGDPDGDVLFYLAPLDAVRTAAADAQDVDAVIQGCFGLWPEDTNLRFLMPHYHLDHYNADLLLALQPLGYAPARTKLQIHARDLGGATCEQPCCGLSPCPAPQGSPGVGAPFDPPLPPEYVLEPIGELDDACGDVAMTFETPLGQWTTRLQTGHTAGALNLDNEAQQIRLIGGAGPCPPLPSPEWLLIWPHDFG